MSLRNINYILTRVGREAGVCTPNPRYVGVGPHLIRHSFARNWKRSGGSIESLQKILGHASVKTTLDCYGTEDQREVEANYRQRHSALVAPDCAV
jgi:site-specific recombinase XerD